MTTRWLREHLSGLENSKGARVPRIEAVALEPILAGRYYWDQCPIFAPRGGVATIEDHELWIALSAPRTEEPDSRHDEARLRLLTRHKDRWSDCDDLLPEGFSPGACEWAGAAYLDPDRGVRLFYTARGTAGETAPSYRQRLFSATGRLLVDESVPRVTDWHDHGELIQADGVRYQLANEVAGQPGAIKAFRDPFYFVDPVTRREHLLFSASDAKASSAKNAAIGHAVADSASGGWTLQDPILTADTVTNEVERPHFVHHAGLYYLFWSCHGWTFASDIVAPSGLYGMVAESLRGPYTLLNQTGLVAGNPIDQPYQSYSWLVTNDLMVASFIDMLDGAIASGPESPPNPLGTFEGLLAPSFQIRLDSASASIRA